MFYVYTQHHITTTFYMTSSKNATDKERKIHFFPSIQHVPRNESVLRKKTKHIIYQETLFSLLLYYIFILGEN